VWLCGWAMAHAHEVAGKGACKWGRCSMPRGQVRHENLASFCNMPRCNIWDNLHCDIYVFYSVAMHGHIS
jgi:hypothetical protein